MYLFLQTQFGGIFTKKNPRSSVQKAISGEVEDGGGLRGSITR